MQFWTAGARLVLVAAIALCLALAFASAPHVAWAAADSKAPTSHVSSDLVPATIETATSPNADLTQAELDTAAVAPATDDLGKVMHRLYNPNSGEHFYTASTSERDNVVKAGWRYEGVGWVAPSAGDEVFRLYNPNAGDHHYTLSASERDWLVGLGWRYEGVGWLSGGSCALLRQYNPNAVAGSHNFTCSKDENDYLASVGWHAEGVGWYALADAEATFMKTVSETVAAAVARVSSADTEAHVVSTASESMNYLLLPSYADLSAVRLSAVFKGAEVPIMVADYGSTDFTTVAAGNTVDVAKLSTKTADNGAHLLWFKTASTSVVQQLAIMTSSAINAVHVSSVNAAQGRAYVEASADHSAKADVCVTVIGQDGATVYDKDNAKNASTIKGRGNNTWGIGDKKPYQISLNKKADLLGTGIDDKKQKKWVLLANANDATLLHNTIAYNLGLELGMVGTECAPVDLYYDGQYRGSYLLCEKIQVKEGRVAIDDLEGAFEEANPGVDFEELPTAQATNDYGKTYQYVTGVADPEDVTGGYLLEIDGAYYANEPCWFDSSWGIIVVKSPEYCSQAAMSYISNYVECAILRLEQGKTTAEPGDSSGALFDLDSLAKTYLVSEFAKNIDAFLTSTYLYKDSGATPLYGQPLWDFDGSMGVRTDWGDTSFMTYQGFTLPHVYVATESRTVPVGNVAVVQDRARELWGNTLSPLLKSVLLSTNNTAVGQRGFLRSLAYYRIQIAASQKMNEVLFGLTAFNNELDPFETYELNFNYLRNWLTWRVAWLDANFWRLADGRVNNSPWTYQGYDYGLVFDASYYIAQNADSIGPVASDAGVLEHFVKTGMVRGLVASRNFDVHVYKERYADLREAFGDDLTKYYIHFIESGFKEGRTAV